MDKMDLILDEIRNVNARLDKIEEDLEITRVGVNSLLGWAEHVSNAISFPLPKI